MRLAWVVALAGCQFDHGQLTGGPRDGASDDGASDDAASDAPRDAPVDARPDATPDAPTFCHVGVASTTGVDRGRVGGNGGGDNFPALVCQNATDRIVGIALKMSNQDNDFGGRSAQGIRIACAAVTVNSAGVGTTGTITTYEVVGLGTFGWAPSTWTPITQCKPGWIMSGLNTHTSNNGSFFVDSTIYCSQIGPTGLVVATESIYVTGSLNESNGLDTVQCNTGEIIVRMSNRTGAGLDSVNLWCTTPTCN